MPAVKRIPHVFLELLQFRNMCYKAVLNNIFQVGVEKGEVLLGRKKLPCFQQLWWRAAGNRFITNKNVFKLANFDFLLSL